MKWYVRVKLEAEYDDIEAEDEYEAYEIASEAAIAENVNASHISGCARGKRHTCGGYKWIYE